MSLLYVIPKTSGAKGGGQGLSIEEVAKEAHANVPVLFMLSPGAQVAQDLQHAATSSVGADNFFEVRLLNTKIFKVIVFCSCHCIYAVHIY